MTVYFNHEKLHVYQESLRFVTWATELLGSVTGRHAVKDQLDRASTSVPLNIAEGNGKFSDRDRCRFLDIAHGSALECAACLDVLIAKRLVEAERIDHGKQSVHRIVSMLVKLRAGFADRVREESAEYVTGYEHEPQGPVDYDDDYEYD